MTRYSSKWLIACAALALAPAGQAQADERSEARKWGPAAQTAQTTQIPPECERLTDPIQRAKCVEEKSKGKK